MPVEIFVFGSNLQGIHGKGAALDAVKHHGAIRGIGRGRQGNSYAIPTKATPYQRLPLDVIGMHIEEFLAHVGVTPDDTFNITKVGCGLAGYDWDKDIRPLFPDPLPKNCRFI